jgi:hypothetical protein
MARLELEGYRSAELIAKLDMRCRCFPVWACRWTCQPKYLETDLSEE